MDVSAPEIVFDDKGVCNFCHQAQKQLAEIRANASYLPAIIKDIKDLKGQYDCLIGLSGGVDSSYMLMKAVELGLKPLCFTIDNGWNDAKADENIMRLVEGLKVPFFRYTIDLPKFKELQGAFLKAGVRNIEIPSDHILMAATFEMAEKNNIKWILSGGNVATESIMPPSWGYSARDLKHIKAIYHKFTGKALFGLPMCSLEKWNYYRWIVGLKTLYLLDYLDYNREAAIKELEEKFGYQPYGDKHCESTWTWWFQNYYLFEKFGIDKRKAHLSSMINSGQMSRKDALDIVHQSPVYPRLGIEEKIMKYPKHQHSDYPQDEWLFNLLSKVVKYVGA